MFAKAQRIPSVAISPLLRHGKRVRGAGLDFIFQKTDGPSQFTVIVSVKIDKRATMRNRMKRLVRESVQHMLPSFQQNVQGVFVVRARLPDNEKAVETTVGEMLKKAGLLNQES